MPRKRSQSEMPEAARNCARCGERRPADDFYFVSRKTGKRRGQCKDCVREVKRLQREPGWMPECARCGQERERVGPGRRLCAECFALAYDAEDRRTNGSHRLRLKDCRTCGARRLRDDHEFGTMLCPTCRSIPQHRRKRLVGLFNLTPPEYLGLLDAQGHVCAICKRPPTHQALHIDHRHAEPSILRGGLCNTCNTLIGLAKDDPARLRAAADYLDNPPAQVLFPGRVTHPAAQRAEYTPMRRGRGWMRAK